MPVRRWQLMCALAMAVLVISVEGAYAKTSIGQMNTTMTSASAQDQTPTVDQSPKTINVIAHPLDLILTGLQDITLSADVRVARFLTLGVDYRISTGESLLLEYFASNTPLTGFRIRGDAYLNGRAFTSSVVAQLNYQFLSITRTSISGNTEALEIAGPGVMLGWRWFWTDPGESGLNLGLMAGAGALSGENSNERLDKVLLDLRVELGIAF